MNCTKQTTNPPGKQLVRRGQVLSQAQHVGGVRRESDLPRLEQVAQDVPAKLAPHPPQLIQGAVPLVYLVAQGVGEQNEFVQGGDRYGPVVGLQDARNQLLSKIE